MGRVSAFQLIGVPDRPTVRMADLRPDTKDLAMIRKSAVAVTAAAALALGTASATSLGTFDDVGFAASDVGLISCDLTGEALTLVPDLDADLSVLAALTDPVETFTLDAILVDLSAFTDCIGLDADVVLVDAADAVLETLTGTTTATGITLDSLGLVGDTTIKSITDIADIDEVRIVVRTVTP